MEQRVRGRGSGHRRGEDARRDRLLRTDASHLCYLNVQTHRHDRPAPSISTPSPHSPRQTRPIYLACGCVTLLGDASQTRGPAPLARARQFLVYSARFHLHRLRSSTLLSSPGSAWLLCLHLSGFSLSRRAGRERFSLSALLSLSLSLSSRRPPLSTPRHTRLRSCASTPCFT
jgi:hypothetical protein